MTVAVAIWATRRNAELRFPEGAGYRIRCPNFADARFEKRRFVPFMTTSIFRIMAVPTEIAEAARRAANAAAADHSLLTTTAPETYPCRHCLRWAKPGEPVILFPYTAIPSGHPYSESGPIFVHAENCQSYNMPNEYPGDFRTGRAFRVYDSNYNIIDAQLVDGREPEGVIQELFENPQTSFIDVRSLTRGCFTFRIQRG
jgi:hypothetical protein